MTTGIVANRSSRSESGVVVRSRFSVGQFIRVAVWAVALADLAGGLAGYTYWYGSTILASPWYYWIFVPDCPIAATLMGVALIAYLLGRRWQVLGLLAAGTCIKYGLWTVVSWAVEFARGGPADLEGISMLVTHLLLLVQGVVLLWFLLYSVVPVVVASAYLVANDLVDYVGGQYPRLPGSVGVGMMMRIAVATTAVIIVFWTVMTWVSAKKVRAAARAADTGGDAS